MKFFAIIIISIGLLGSALGAGFDPTGGAVTTTIEVAKSADMLSERGLFLASQIVLIAGLCLAGHQILKRLDVREEAFSAISKEYRDFVKDRYAESIASIEQSNALSLKTNELLDDLKDELRKVK